MRLSHIRFEGEIRFPGVARNATTFSEAEGYTIMVDEAWRFVGIDRIPEGGPLVSVVVPWTRVLEAIPWREPSPKQGALLEAMEAIHRGSAITADEPTPVPRARRGRPPKVPAAG